MEKLIYLNLVLPWSQKKWLFCTIFKNAKLPKGFASNISDRVDVYEMKISGYKSHDAHFIMHHLIQIVVRKRLLKNVSLALIRLGNFFITICSRVIRRTDLEPMQIEIKKIVCGLEKSFPPSFFDIMEHLPVHLVDEIRLGGIIDIRWMYSSETKMCRFKGRVRNRRYP